MRKIILALFLAALASQLQAEGAPPSLSGGVGLEEQEMLRSQAGQFNLCLYFSEAASGAYLAGTS